MCTACAQLVETHPRRLKSVIAAKRASTKYRIKGLNSYLNERFQLLIFYKFAMISKNTFSVFSLWAIECRLIGKNGNFIHLKMKSNFKMDLFICSWECYNFIHFHILVQKKTLSFQFTNDLHYKYMHMI